MNENTNDQFYTELNSRNRIYSNQEQSENSSNTAFVRIFACVVIVGVGAISMLYYLR